MDESALIILAVLVAVGVGSVIAAKWCEMNHSEHWKNVGEGISFEAPHRGKQYTTYRCEKCGKTHRRYYG